LIQFHLDNFLVIIQKNHLIIFDKVILSH
jgi:hypothetical protein